MKKALLLFAIIAVSLSAFAVIDASVLMPPGAGEVPILGPSDWQWENPGPAATETEVYLEILPQVGLNVYETVDLGPICIMNDFSRIWDFQFYTKNNCNAVFTLHWDFVTVVPTCTQEVTPAQIPDIRDSILAALELWYIGFYRWDYTVDPPAYDPNFIAPPTPIQLVPSTVTSFFINRCFRQHWLRFHWGKIWDECLGDWCLNMPAGMYEFLIEYTIDCYCPEEPGGGDDVPDYDCTVWGNT